MESVIWNYFTLSFWNEALSDVLHFIVIFTSVVFITVVFIWVVSSRMSTVCHASLEMLRFDFLMSEKSCRLSRNLQEYKYETNERSPDYTFSSCWWSLWWCPSLGDDGHHHAFIKKIISWRIIDVASFMLCLNHHDVQQRAFWVHTSFQTAKICAIQQNEPIIQWI